MKLSRDLIYMMAVALVFVIAAQLGVPKAFGAHPWWATSVVYLGLLFGLLPALAVRLWVPNGLIWPAVTAVGFAVLVTVTVIGKTRFAASYAEDRLAGDMWHKGWIGSVALLFILAAFVWRERRE